jgi:hypothetical protein
MAPKQLVYAAFEGIPADRMAVSVPYTFLYYMDHFAELTGRPQWELKKWYYAPLDEYLSVCREMIEAAPFDILQPPPLASVEERADVEFVERNGIPLLHRKREDVYEPLIVSESGHAVESAINEECYVFDEADMRERLQFDSAEKMIASGANDHLDVFVREFGNDWFILTGGVIGTFYMCHHYVGMTNLLEMVLTQPSFVHMMSKRILEYNIEMIRRYAAADGDAIYIDDAMATSDLISRAHYEEFCLPYVSDMVREIHHLGHKAILIYFGGIADRLEEIVSTGADALVMETSMKGYTNDIEEIATRIGSRMTLFGNIDPIRIVQDGTDEELAAEIEKQAKAGRMARGFVMSTGSPLTPSTPLVRVKRFIELARNVRYEHTAV